jgi:hypothetical protein
MIHALECIDAHLLLICLPLHLAGIHALRRHCSEGGDREIFARLRLPQVVRVHHSNFWTIIFEAVTVIVFLVLYTSKLA